MITLSKDGQWHEYFDRYKIDLPRNLCMLFWKCLLWPVVHFGVGTLLALTLIYLLIGHLQFFAWLFFDTGIPTDYVFWTFLALIGWGVAAGIYLTRKMKQILSGVEVRPLSWATRLRAVRQSNFVQVPKAAYKGFKEKFCPLVTWQ